ncbi:MAG: hypothetical protein A3H52_00355 [Candidatus Zambryskibacteria bacterium RIFCSPLOWO2_02_FULL_39_26]|uniref:Peptidoglycan binding-like domain-containing protein n=1 Tax=Candidatus Zambryskibacteria bacterium RIFCSPLOWO2_12_FULL_39_23 TaxID=1802776 RepID=A0A1G2URZ5_9BACT|nr:MAG: hypothetical protein A3H52_00355 [Candidatus Zambryskibacteria bacterium RIFCSPLOWO2_02_FULL_39_26]OHB12175.1 MAG: hypothetical protein A3G99_00885 [Candidatus Zambryskibacteria bacterium RIFCSPLOWO2_12_FULL_39_23]
MKKLIIYLSLLSAPFIALADYNDVSLTSSAIISVGGMTLNVDGESSVVESIVVSASSFTVNLLENSLFSVTSADRYTLSSDAPIGNITSNQCADVSKLSLSATSTQAVIITPSTTVCSVNIGSGGGGGSSGSGNPSTPVTTTSTGSGGGGGGIVATPTASSATTQTSSTSSLQNQIAALLAQVQLLQAQLGIVSIGSGTGFVFSRNLIVGSTGADVKNLQKVLNSDSDTQIASSGVGSPGNETTYFGSLTRTAIQKFQVKYGIAGPGAPGYGVFGPKTRAKMAEVSKLKGF